MPIPTSERPFDKLATQLAADRFEGSPTFASDLGLTEYDHLLPDMSAAAIRARERRQDEWTRRLRDLPTDDLRVAIQEGDNLEPSGGKAQVGSERLTQVAQPNDRHGPFLGEPELAGDLMGEHLDAIPDPTNAVRAQMAEVPSQLGRTDPGRGGQLFGRDGGNTALGEVAQCAQVLRQSGNRGVGYLSMCCGVGDHEVTGSSRV